jgi:hypothetical protein
VTPGARDGAGPSVVARPPTGDVVFGNGAGARALAYFAAAPTTGRAARPFPEHRRLT